VMDFLAATDVGKFPAQMNDGMEEAQRRAQVRGGGNGGLQSFLLFLSFSLLVFGLVLLLFYLLTFIYISGDEG